MTSKITFCVTSRNRLWQLKQTLASNLSLLSAHHTISLVDFGSSDGLSVWVWTNFRSEIETGRLLFFEVQNEVRWNCPIAKNLAHRLAPGDYLFNLDADNRIGEADVRQITEAASRSVACHQWSGTWGDGSHGRIGLPRDVFRQIGGYDEAFLPMGGEDLDLLERIRQLGHPVEMLKAPATAAVTNSFDQRMAEVARVSDNAENSFEQIKAFNAKMRALKSKLEGPIRLGGFKSFRGRLNGRPVTIDGFDTVLETAESRARCFGFFRFSPRGR